MATNTHWRIEVEIMVPTLGQNREPQPTKRWVWLADGDPGSPAYSASRERARRFADVADAFAAVNLLHPDPKAVPRRASRIPRGEAPSLTPR